MNTVTIGLKDYQNMQKSLEVFEALKNKKTLIGITVSGPYSATFYQVFGIENKFIIDLKKEITDAVNEINRSCPCKEERWRNIKRFFIN